MGGSSIDTSGWGGRFPFISEWACFIICFILHSHLNYDFLCKATHEKYLGPRLLPILLTKCLEALRIGNFTRPSYLVIEGRVLACLALIHVGKPSQLARGHGLGNSSWAVAPRSDSTRLGERLSCSAIGFAIRAAGGGNFVLRGFNSTLPAPAAAHH